MKSVHAVLIESDWNLKLIGTVSAACLAFVLIESDWNLKISNRYAPHTLLGINRIRLEFKAQCLHM